MISVSTIKTMTAPAWALVLVLQLPVAPSSAQTTANEQQFTAMKTVAGRLVRGITFKSQYRDDVIDCGGGGVLLGLSESEPAFDMAATAVYVTLLRRRLTELGLADVGEPFIRQIEQITVAKHRRDETIAAHQAKHAIAGKMGIALNTAMRNRNIKGAFEIEGGCGAGEVKYRLVPSDKAARLFVIKQFYFQVCEARGLEGFDQKKCEGWQEATGRDEMSGAGMYKYSAVWPDGKVTTGDFPVTDKLVDDINNERRKPVVSIPINR